MRTVSRLLGIAMLSSLAGCYVETIEHRPPPVHPPHPGPAPGPAPARPVDAVAVGAIEPGGRGEAQYAAPDVAVGFAAPARGGARWIAQLAGGTHLFAYGPLGPEGWGRAPIVAQGGAHLDFTVPADGTYLIAALDAGRTNAAFAIELTCASEECRVECGAGGECPAGSGCAFVQCIRAPCPSYCHGLLGAPPPDDPTPPPGGSIGLVCGTRGAAPCPPEMFCLHPDSARCGETDAPGACQPMPEICTREYRAVCGCDGRTYGNRCTAHGAGVSVRHDGPCASAPGGGGGGAPAACARAGCGGELCAEAGAADGIVSACVARPEHACYQRAACERQPDGQCGWTRTRALDACLARAHEQR